MKTIIRSFLVATLLIVSLVLLLSEPANRFLQIFNVSATHERLALIGMMALAGVFSSALAFLLLPAACSFARGLLQTVGMAALFVAGLVVLGRVNWGTPTLTHDPWDLSISWPFLAIGVLGFGSFSLISLLAGPGSVRPVELPSVLRGYLHDGEVPLCRIQQTRLKEPITPDNLVATNQRLIVHHPKNLGFTSTIEDYNYIDIANVRMERGWLFCTVSMKERFQGNNMLFPDMPKRAGEQFVRIVTEQIHKKQDRIPLRAAGSSAGQHARPDIPAILRSRLEAGQITGQQYDELMHKLAEQRGEPW
jgi:hypothetical protein